MGRPESPVAGDDPLLAAFAADLRLVRQNAGTPAYRELARRANYSATVLSQAASGHTMPSLPVTLAFVGACGGDQERWRARWREIAMRQEGQNGQEAPAEPEVTRKKGGWASLTRWLGGHPAVLALALFALLAVGTGVGAALPGPTPAQHDTAVARTVAVTARDGGDPNAGGCSGDGITVAQTELRYRDGQQAGTVELRYSPSCGAAWTRFDPAATPQPGVTVTVRIERPASHVGQTYTTGLGDDFVYGDVLRTAPACVVASAALTTAQGDTPYASTPCWRPKT